MKNFFLCLAFLLFCFPAFADENIDELLRHFPVVLTFESVLPKSNAENAAIIQRSDLLPSFSIGQIRVKNEDIYLNEEKVEILSPAKSKTEFENYYERVKTKNRAIYRMEFTIDVEGEYVVATQFPLGTLGFLNQEPIVSLYNGVLTKSGSAKQTVFLKKGKQILYLCINVINRGGIALRFVPLTELPTAKAKLEKHLLSANQADRDWMMKEFSPSLVNLRPNGYSFFVKELKRQHKLKPFVADANTMLLFKSLLPQADDGCYFVENFIFTELPDLYFFLNKSGADKSSVYDGFLVEKNSPRQDFLRQLIWNYQRNKEKIYLDKVTKIISDLPDFTKKDNYFAELYKTQFLSLFRIGRIRESIEMLKMLQEKKIPVPLGRYVDDKPDQEDMVTLTQSFDETAAFQLQETLEGYEGSADRLQAIYKTFTTLENILVKRNDGAVSLPYIFETYKNANKTLKEDFAKLCAEKVKALVEKAKEANSINDMENILKQYELIVALPELHFILMNEYYTQGAFLKSLSHAHTLFDKYPSYHSNQVVTRMILLEDFSDIAYESRRVIPKELLKVPFKIRGQNTTVEAFLSKRQKVPNNGPGELVAAVPLEIPHIQYLRHLQLPFVQPVEPLFLQNNILLNGGGYLYNFSISQKKVTWKHQSLMEYHNADEQGLFQKRFVTEHSGDQIFTITNSNFSSDRTIKSFNLKGELLWDAAELNNTFLEDPLCTPIASHGKLFCFSYSKKEAIRTINFSTYDVATGKQQTRLPISYLPTKVTDNTGRQTGSRWNTFSHDQHFCTDEDFVYGYSGSGVVMKVNAANGNVLWEKGFVKTSFNSESHWFWNQYGSAPSGFIKLSGDFLITYMPDIQNFIVLNKVTGDLVWRSAYYWPTYIHARTQTQYLYFSQERVRNESILSKVDIATGAIIWQVPMNGLPVVGEGEIFGNQLWVPAEKAILVFDIQTGSLIKKIDLAVQPLKICSAAEMSVLLTANVAYILRNNGTFDAKSLVDQEPVYKDSPIIEPDVAPQPIYSFENINLETTLKIPEKYYTSSDRWKQTQLLRTSKPFHFILKCNEYLTLFREGYSLKDGSYIPPEVIWADQYPWYAIKDDVLYISELGKITARDLFTRKKIWEHTYDHYVAPVRQHDATISEPVIAVTDQYICIQTAFRSLRVLDIKTRNTILEIPTEPIRYIRMYQNYIVASWGSGVTRCYDIDQKGKEIWNVKYDHFGDMFVDQGMLVFVRTNNGTITYYDFKTGAPKLQAGFAFSYIMNRFKLGSKILYAYNKLYDAKSGAPFGKYAVGTAVVGGGYLGFFKRYGQEGGYIDENGKEYLFKTQGSFNDDNYLYTVGRKGNRIVLFSFFFVETFEISGDKLISVDYASVTTGKYGNHANQFNMDLFVLDDSLLEIREDNMYFFRNFDTELRYEAIQSFNVENKNHSYWPYSETYPEVEVTDKNWISYFKAKPKRQLAYQLFTDEDYAYVKFKLSPNMDNHTSTTLYMSSDGSAEKISFIWDVDHWRNAQTSYFVKDNTETWKEIDVFGNVNLFFKIKLAGAYRAKGVGSLPVFNIEFRQMTGHQSDGMYRIGGAYQGIINQIPWLNYINDESQTLRDLSLRTEQYEKNTNFYPQGYDVVIWLKDRRKLKGIDDNLATLRKMLAANAKFYCSVNILSALFFEELQKKKQSDENFDELADDFPVKVQKIITDLHKEAMSVGMSKEWADFSLSLWGIEVFPKKISYSANRNYYTKPYYGIQLRTDKKVITTRNFKNQTELFSVFFNQPFIEWIIPGLIPNFPEGQTIQAVTFIDFGVNKTALGRMIRYVPDGNTEYFSREGKFSDGAYQIKHEQRNQNIALKKTHYQYKGKRYACAMLDIEYPIGPFTVPLLPIKMLGPLKTTGQTAETILTALEHLPSDNNNGSVMIDNYIALSGKVDDEGLFQLYVKWLESLKGNVNACVDAFVEIQRKSQGRKNIFQYIEDVAKKAKIPPLATRIFYVRASNIFGNKQSRSVLGPFLTDLVNKPENNFNASLEYKTVDTVHKFGEVLEQKSGGSIYIAAKINIDSKEKVFLLMQAVNHYSTSHTATKISVWVNDENITKQVTFADFNNDLYHQRLTLKRKSENILLIRMDGLDNHSWSDYNYRICLGDNYGAPIEGLTVTPVHK